jgi:single-strand DNA-binding protein
VFNKVILIGRLTADPVLKYSPQGKAVVSFTLAVDRFSEGTDYFDIVGFEKLAEISNKYLKKGRLVMIEGRLQTRVFERNDGTKSKSFEIIMENMKMLDKKPESDNVSDKTEPKEYKTDYKDLKTETKFDHKESKSTKFKKPYEEEEIDFEQDLNFDEFQEEDSFTVNPKSSFKEQPKDLPKEFKKNQEYKPTDHRSTNTNYSKRISKPFEDDEFDELFFNDN